MRMQEMSESRYSNLNCVEILNMQHKSTTTNSTAFIIHLSVPVKLRSGLMKPKSNWAYVY